MGRRPPPLARAPTGLAQFCTTEVEHPRHLVKYTRERSYFTEELRKCVLWQKLPYKC
jgi:hypothetical protein